MTTDKPKLSAYVPQPIKERVRQFADERKLSESQAVTTILTEYFGIEQEMDGLGVGGVTLARMEALEKKMQDLQVKVETQQQPEKDPLNLIYEKHYSNSNGSKKRKINA